MRVSAAEMRQPSASRSAPGAAVPPRYVAEAGGGRARSFRFISPQIPSGAVVSGR